MSDAQVLVGRYRLIRELGAGAMGTVWLAQDNTLKRQVAVKRVTDPLTPQLGRQAEMARLRAMREGRVAARLSHPNAVGIYDVAIHDGEPWLVMEYVPSRTLSDIVHTHGPIPPQRAALLGTQIASALAEAHRVGIVHRDVKPSNLLLTEDGQAKLTDFGIARSGGDATLTASGLVTGTPAYFAPELARGAEPASASDTWSLGATLYFAVEGTPPFGNDDNPLVLLGRVANQPVPPPTRAGELTATIMRLLHRDPARRPTMVEARSMLAALSKGTETIPLALLQEELDTDQTDQEDARATTAEYPRVEASLASSLPAAGPSSEEVVTDASADGTPRTAASVVRTDDSARSDDEGGPDGGTDPVQHPGVTLVEPTVADGTDQTGQDVIEQPDPVQNPDQEREVVRHGVEATPSEDADRAARVTVAASAVDDPLDDDRSGKAGPPDSDDAPEPVPSESAEQRPSHGGVRRRNRALLVLVLVLVGGLGTYLVATAANLGGEAGNSGEQADNRASRDRSEKGDGSEQDRQQSSDRAAGQRGPQPTAENAPSPTPTPTPTPSPTRPEARMTASAMEQLTSRYYAALPSDTDAGWSMLGPELRSQGRDDYDWWWGQVRSVQASNVRANPGEGTVTLTVTFVMNNGNNETEQHLLGLVKSGDGAQLLINTDRML